jgi:regulator of ribosome biosynthesis
LVFTCVTFCINFQKWVPRYGFRRAAAEKEKSWLLPVPDTGDPNEDQFSKLSGIKNENVAKNEFQRLRNLAKAKNVKIPRVGFLPVDKLNSKQVTTFLIICSSIASFSVWW